MCKFMTRNLVATLFAIMDCTYIVHVALFLLFIVLSLVVLKRSLRPLVNL